MVNEPKGKGASGWSYEAIKSLLRDRPVAYHPILAKKLGGVNPALFLSQILYWQDKGDSPDGWIHKSQPEFEEETGLTRYEQEGARKKLKHHGVLEDKRSGLPAKLYYRPNIARLIEILSEEQDQGDAPEGSPPLNPCTIQIVDTPQTRLRVYPKPKQGQSANKDAEIPQPLYRSESTSKNTPETDLPSVDQSAPSQSKGPTDRRNASSVSRQPSPHAPIP